MTKSKVNSPRFDPYKNFKFRLKSDGKYVAGISKVGGLKRTSESVGHREGGDPSTSRKFRGGNKFEAITLDRGVTHDRQFEEWARRAQNLKSATGHAPKDIVIEVYNEAGRLASSYKVYRCRVSEFQGMPDLDTNANAVLIQHIKLENEGFDRM